MIRVVLYLAIVGLCALGAAWLADRPGDVAIVWQGWRIETSVMVLIVATAAVAILSVILWSALRAIVRAPRRLTAAFRSRRGSRGYDAVSRGLIAIGSGDAVAARQFASEARRLAPHEPLTLLLAAQAAQMSGDRGDAERTFRTMAGREDTKLLGLHGLFMEARRRQDATAARLYAEEAARGAPALEWAGHAVLEFRSMAGDWAGALECVDRNLASNLIDKRVWRRQRAVLLTARALGLEESDRDAARALAVEATGLAPDLVPAAALAGRLLGEAGELRKASRIVETAWRAGPHPDLADTYIHLRVGDSALDRLGRAQTLARLMPRHAESALAVARAAIDAREFTVAREALAPLLSAPTQRVATMMARLERVESGDEGRAREWMTRALHAARDPAWTADGLTSERWLPVSPASGQLDAFAWKVPLEELGRPQWRIAEDADMLVANDPPALASPDAQTEPAERGPPPPPPEASTAAAKPASVRPEPIIPVLPVPDDPGPGETAAPARGGAWNRLREMFS